MKKANKYFENWLKQNKEQFDNFLIKTYEKLGPGLYCHDLLICNNELYLTEFGYKSYGVLFHKLLDQNKIKMGKKFEKIQEYIKFYNDTYFKL